MGEMDKGRGSSWNAVAGTLETPRADTRAKLREAVGTAKDAAKDKAGTAKVQLESMADAGKDRVAGQLGSVAQALRSAGRGEGSDGAEGAAIVSRYASRVGDEIERASRYLREHAATDLLHEVERAARREPLIFLGGAFVAGIALGRLLKSGAPRASGAGTDASASYDGPIDRASGGAAGSSVDGRGTGSTGDGSSYGADSRASYAQRSYWDESDYGSGSSGSGSSERERSSYGGGSYAGGSSDGERAGDRDRWSGSYANGSIGSAANPSPIASTLGTPSVPGTSAAPSASGTPAAPSVPGTFATPSVPGAFAAPSVPGTSGLSSAPGTSAASNPDRPSSTPGASKRASSVSSQRGGQSGGQDGSPGSEGA